MILILVGFNCRRCYLNVVDGLQLSLEDELNDGEKGHEEDKDEDDDEEVDGDSIVGFDDSSDRNAEDDHSKNLKKDDVLSSFKIQVSLAICGGYVPNKMSICEYQNRYFRHKLS